MIDLLPSMLLLGVGAGLAFPALMTLAMSAATPGDAGLASGLVNTTVQVGGALGLAVLATLASTHTGSLLAAGDGRAAALTGGYHLAWLVSMGIAIGSLAVAFGLIRSRAGNELAAHAPAAVDGEETLIPQSAYMEAA